jgi:CubicO group peptidase (beta-lactamase class C family)
MPKQICTALVGTCLAAAVVTAAQSPLPRTNAAQVGLDPAKLTEATTLLDQFVTDGKIAGAVAAVARNGRLAYLQAVGVQDLRTRAPMTERSLFRIYSMTRPITAVAVMMLNEEKRFELDDPISRYIPEFDRVTVVDSPGATPRKPARSISVRDLLLHTSGINDRNSDPYRAAQVRSRSIPMSTFLDNVIRVPLMEDPGTRFRYGESTTILGRLVEVWSEQSFEAFLETRVFTPLKMVDTVFVVDESRRSRLATVYTPGTNGGLVPRETEAVPFTERPQLIEGTVGLVSTVPDFLRFSQMLLNRGELDGVRVLQAATVDRMTANGLPEEVLRRRSGTMGWGLANVNVQMDAASPRAGEYSWDGTAGTIFWNDPTRQMVTMVWTQSQPSNPDQIRQKFKALIQAAVKE